MGSRTGALTVSFAGEAVAGGAAESESEGVEEAEGSGELPGRGAAPLAVAVETGPLEGRAGL
ncbi:hypothetical protein [Streptomyces caeruleatus]|uniref:hypothetical protein n=1 Tax=Streptomyces caeruleatus TaxID=661399 RepID=UPI00078810FD